MASERNDFLRDIIDDDLRTGRHTHVATRFPPEPNGYLHIGHAKSICLNFGLARDYQGTCNLRFDDTNPEKEDLEYVEQIEHDVRWLGFAPTAVLFSADYFPRMYELAEQLVTAGKAYVCDLSDEEIKVYRGSLTEPGKPSPFRDRSPAENLDLLRRMKAGEFPDGARTLRAKIDMASANMKMRDPLLYRIRHAHHHRTGDAWCIYPMYDYAHPLEDAIEAITHSICTLEFENNRELYDWVIEHTGAAAPPVPRQYEFARLNLDYTVMSKRKLLRLVKEHHVTGWDDPRMPTLAGMRRRGYRPEAIRALCDMVGVAKANSVVDIGKLEFCVRDDLNRIAPRVLGVVRPLAVEITNREGPDEAIEAPYFPPDVGTPEGAAATRPIAFASHLYIDHDDFRDDPPADYQRLAPGRTVRLRYGYCITCDAVERDATGKPIKLACSFHPETRGGKPPADGRKVHGVIHWVSAHDSVSAEVRLYDRLFKSARPEESGDFLADLNPESMVVVEDARLEASLAAATVGSRWQLERVGYFIVDEDSRPGRLVLNKIIGLRDTWADAAKAAAAHEAKEAKEAKEPRDKPENARAKTRPKSKSPAEHRAEARARDRDLQAAYDRMLELGLAADAADLLTGDLVTAQTFHAAAKGGTRAPAVARWMINELPRALGGKPLGEAGLDLDAFAGRLAELVELAETTLPGPAAKEVLAEVVRTGKDPRAIVAERGLDAVADTGELDRLVDDVLGKNPDKVAQYKGGKTGLLGFFVGQVVKASGGKADPQAVSKLIGARLA
jgi:glutaminyl-tRNA synthetase